MSCNCNGLLQLDAGPQGVQGPVNPALPTFFNLEVKLNVSSSGNPLVPWTINGTTEVSKSGSVWNPIGSFSVVRHATYAEITISNFLSTSYASQNFTAFIDRKQDVMSDTTTYPTFPVYWGHPWRWEISEYGANSIKIFAIDTATRNPRLYGYVFAPQIATTSFSLLIMTQ